jgi:hypothetical protein
MALIRKVLTNVNNCYDILNHYLKIVAISNNLIMNEGFRCFGN